MSSWDRAPTKTRPHVRRNLFLLAWRVRTVTMPLMRPLSFVNAVMAPMASAPAISAGRSALLRCSAVINRVASSSSSNTLERSFVSPASPAAEPLGALRRLLAYFSWSNSNFCCGLNLVTSNGIASDNRVGSTLGVAEIV